VCQLPYGYRGLSERRAKDIAHQSGTGFLALHPVYGPDIIYLTDASLLAVTGQAVQRALSQEGFDNFQSRWVLAVTWYNVTSGYLVKAKFHCAVQLASRSQTSSRPNSITLSNLRPARGQVFDQLASWFASC